MNPDLNKLHPYPFEKLAALKANCNPPTELEHIALSIGEPKHPAPEIVLNAITSNLKSINSYPLTRGIVELRKTIADWLENRFSLKKHSVNIEENVLPVNGTREALFAFAQCLINANKNSVILMPNPFYQIYEGAAYLAGATPMFYNTVADNNYLPDFDAIDDDTWQKCEILYICTPNNPTGAVIAEKQLIQLIKKAQQYNFVIASDECYSEIYFDESTPPAGLLGAAQKCGNNTFDHCVVFHSLSKRSNLPGMRSGFVAGDAKILKQFLLYRTYHGSAMPPVHQLASITAWSDESHVKQNRALYTKKFEAIIDILKPIINITKPDAGFYIWLRTPIDDADFAQGLFDTQNVTVLPGSYLSREHDNINPGSNHVRMALVAPINECVEAANRIKTYIKNLK